ncbi:hypothetical protein Bbelb_308260 [Branchiostoma belcheri]|nr:hypothetical protein Bbelb_308260 [Branchiostoma belcheri]
MALLYFIYGGTIDLPNNVTPSEVVPLADMYGLEGLKDVAALVLKHNSCHLFHKPCTGCLTAVPDCLALAHTFGMEGLYTGCLKLSQVSTHNTGCLKWISKHFAKVWPTQTFANLPTQLMHKCFSAIQETLTNENAVAMAIESDKLQSTIPSVKWAEPVRELSVQLRDACVGFMVQNFGYVVGNGTFCTLLRLRDTCVGFMVQNFGYVVGNGTFCTLLRGMGWKGQFVSQVFSALVDSLTPDNCCHKFWSVNRLKQLGMTDDWNSCRAWRRRRLGVSHIIGIGTTISNAQLSSVATITENSVAVTHPDQTACFSAASVRAVAFRHAQQTISNAELPAVCRDALVKVPQIKRRKALRGGVLSLCNTNSHWSFSQQQESGYPTKPSCDNPQVV